MPHSLFSSPIKKKFEYSSYLIELTFWIYKLYVIPFLFIKSMDHSAIIRCSGMIFTPDCGNNEKLRCEARCHHWIIVSFAP